MECVCVDLIFGLKQKNKVCSLDRNLSARVRYPEVDIAHTAEAERGLLLKVKKNDRYNIKYVFQIQKFLALGLVP